MSGQALVERFSLTEDDTCYVSMPLFHSNAVVAGWAVALVSGAAIDADNPLRVAFGNEASDREIDEFGRRFYVDVWDGFGATENAVIVTREPGTPEGSIGKGLEGVAVYDSDTVRECAVARFDTDGPAMCASSPTCPPQPPTRCSNVR
jgi:fatty-acyl-CoA synthase